ncbi:MAG: NAD(P)H-binding protein [Spirochaetales bacterium]
MTVAVFGATGFVGSSLVKKLVDRGHRVRMISRTSPTGGLSAGVTHRTADIGNANQVSEAVGDADVAVNLVAASPLLPASNRSVYLRRHLRGVSNLLAAVGTHRVGLVHVGALGVTEESPAYYAWTKARAERLVRESSVDAVVVSPSILFGTKSELIVALGAMTRLPIVPIPRIETLFQPMWIEDLTTLLADLVEDRRRYCEGSTCRQLEVGGPAVMSGTEFARSFVVARGKPFVEVPSGAVAAAISLGRTLRLPAFPFDLPVMLEMENSATGRFPFVQTGHTYADWLSR